MLGLVSESMTRVGARALASALQQNTSLQHLDISLNNIGQDGAKEIAFALKRNSEYVCVCVYGCV